MTPEKLVKVLGFALALSLAANFFIGGKILGHSFLCKQEEWQGKDQALREKMPEADRAIISAEMKKRRPDFERRREALAGARKAVNAAAHADPFDEKELNAAMKEEQTKKIDLIRLMQEARRAVVTQISPEGRSLLEKARPPMPPRLANPGDNDDGAGYLPFIWQEDEGAAPSAGTP